MLNETIELLTDYPFDKTRALLDVAAPPAGVTSPGYKKLAHASI
jgi:hypothetical protein